MQLEAPQAGLEAEDAAHYWSPPAPSGGLPAQAPPAPLGPQMKGPAAPLGNALFPSVVRRLSQALPSIAADLLRGASDEAFLDGIMQLESAGAEPSLGQLERLFAGQDGDELLAAQFDALISPDTGENATPPRAAAPLTEEAAHTVRALPSQVALAEAAAARSLLASLETPSAAAPGGRAARRQQAAALKQQQQQQQQYAQMQAQYQQYQQYMQQQQILLGHQMATGLAGLQPPAHLPHATPMYQAVMTPVFVDPRTGRVLQAAGQAVTTLHPGAFSGQQLVLAPHRGPSVPDSASPAASFPSVGAAATSAAAGATNPKAAKRKREPRGSTSRPAASGSAPRDGSAQERPTQLGPGFLVDAKTGCVLRPGPGMAATAVQSRELPAVRSLFEAHAATPFSPSGSPAGHPSLPLAAAPSPPLHLVGQQERAAQAGAAALRLVQSTPVPHEAAAQLLAELAPEARFASSPGPGHSETAAGGGPSQGLPRQAQQPSGAQSRAGPGGGGKAQAAPSAGTRGGGGGATAGRAGAQPPQAGFGSILRGVARELQSAASEPLPCPVGNTESSLRAPEMRGVRRDLNSLTWDAFLESPATQQAPADMAQAGSFMAGFKQEALWLGKFPTREAAGRAVDLAALKLLGREAQTNYPMATYQRHLATLEAHSGEAVVAAIRKDAHMACCRTSKFKGVRRVGPGLYQARLPPPLKQRDDGPAAVPGAGAGNPAVPGAAALPQLTPAQLQLYQQGQLLPLLGHQDGQLPSPVLPVVGAGQGVWGDEQLAQDLLPLGWDAQLWQDLAPGLDEQQQPE